MDKINDLLSLGPEQATLYIRERLETTLRRVQSGDDAEECLEDFQTELGQVVEFLRDKAS